MAKSEWVRVRSESELRPGMAVKVRGKRSGILGTVYVLIRAERDGRPCWRCGCTRGWIDTETFGEFLECYGCAVKHNAVMRLRDLDEADETTEVTKELEVTRG